MRNRLRLFTQLYVYIHARAQVVAGAYVEAIARDVVRILVPSLFEASAFIPF